MSMQKTIISVLALALLAIVACPAAAATYYVATNGSDTTGDGTIGNPYATISKAVGVMVAGDTTYVRGGTYVCSKTISISKSGTSGAYYYLLAYPGEQPILDFSTMPDKDANRGFVLSGSYWYFQGLDVKGAGDNGMWMSGSYNIIEFCDFYENRDSGLQMGGGASYNQILNCDSYYNRDSTDGNADGFSPKLDVGTGNYFYGCRAWQNSDDGYDGYLSSDSDVSTTYENCWCFKNGYLKNGSPSTGNGNGFKMSGQYYRHNVTYINCLCFSNRVKGFDQNHNTGDMTLYNCTSYGNGTYNYAIGEAPASGKTLTLKNCVSHGTGGVSLNAAAVLATNSWMTPFVVTDGDFISVDPTAAYGVRKPDGSLPDISFMHLAAGSDLIDGGTIVDLPYSGMAPDLGCFETDGGGGTPDTTPPTPDPMTWATEPYATSYSSITMVATTATDVSGVQYYFACVSGGGHDSGWQSSTAYTDTGLTPETTYTYRVIARDLSVNLNETAWSTAASAATTPLVILDMYVNDIAMGWRSAGKNYFGQATVWVKDSTGADVSGATVYGNWSGSASGSASGVTGTDGKVMIESPSVKGGGTFTFTVTDIVKTDFVYNAALNVETTDTIVAP